MYCNYHYYALFFDDSFLPWSRSWQTSWDIPWDGLPLAAFDATITFETFLPAIESSSRTQSAAFWVAGKPSSILELTQFTVQAVKSFVGDDLARFFLGNKNIPGVFTFTTIGLLLLSPVSCRLWIVSMIMRHSECWDGIGSKRNILLKYSPKIVTIFAQSGRAAVAWGRGAAPMPQDLRGREERSGGSKFAKKQWRRWCGCQEQCHQSWLMEGEVIWRYIG